MSGKAIYWFDELDIQVQQRAKEEIRDYLNEIIDDLKHTEGRSAELKYFVGLSHSFERISTHIMVGLKYGLIYILKESLS